MKYFPKLKMPTKCVSSASLTKCNHLKNVLLLLLLFCRVNVGFDMVVQDLTISGTLQAIVQLSMDVPFPHIRKATVCFTEKYDLQCLCNTVIAIS